MIEEKTERLTAEVKQKDERIAELETAFRDYLLATTGKRNVTVQFPVSGKQDSVTTFYRDGTVEVDEQEPK